jgi:hypothetical protein
LLKYANMKGRMILKVHSLRLSLFQLELLRDTVEGFGENKKMIHLPTVTGERVPVPLPIDVLDSLIRHYESSVDGEFQTLEYSFEEVKDGIQQVELKWDDGAEDFIRYEIQTEDYPTE